MKQPNIPKELPFLPGNIFTNPYQTKFHKSHIFDACSGAQTESVKVMAEKIDEDLLRSMREGVPKRLEGVPERPLEPEHEGIPKLPPKWLKYDKQVLRFYAFFQEPVHESNVENFRIRKCFIYYYLDDDTFYITEPRIENSGIPQGVFLKRHKVPKPEGGNYSYNDLNIGMNVDVYGRVFRIVDCDDFTKKFYADVGISLNDPEGYPGDLFQANRTMMKTKIPPPDSEEVREYVEKKLNGGKFNKGLQQFLENDRKVLSFDIVWDDSSYDGGMKFFKLDFFLSDNTVEVREVREQNSGKDPYPKMLKRGKLPKIPVLTHCPGMKMKKDEFYEPKDLMLGNQVRVFGRDCLLFDCDPFTKEWYRQIMGIEQKPIQLAKCRPLLKYQPVPPSLGYGSEEDSMGSVKALVPKVPKKDVQKIFKNDLHILRYEASLVSSNADDDSRKFIISFYCGDDTIQIHETPERNSGRIGGKFLDRKNHINPVNGQNYCEKDMQIGALLLLGGHKFRLVKCDEYTEKYFEANPEVFTEASITHVINKILILGKDFPSIEDYAKFLHNKMDLNKDGFLSFDEFCKGLKEMGLILTYQEEHTLMRRFDRNQDNKVSLEEFCTTLLNP